MKNILLITAVTTALFSSASSAKLTSIKVEGINGETIAKALIKLKNSNLSVKTDHQGLAEIDLPMGSHALDVEASNQVHFHHQVIIDENTTYNASNRLLISLQSEPEHKIIIQANPLEHTALDMATPIILLSGDELTAKSAGTLGEILQLEPGLSMSSFGPAVARPVIRGLSGARVKITNNQMTVQDASTNSADHDVGLEPLLAEQIEVVKGPATLLYGSGAIGGVINITDRKINPDLIDGITGGIEMRLADSATGARSGVFTMDTGLQNWNLHLDGFSNKTNDLEIPGFAESQALRDQEASEGESHEEEEAFAILENSHSKTHGGSFGTTRITDNGYWGVSVAKIQKSYAIPCHEEHEDEHDEHQEGIHETEEGVSIDMQQTRYDLQTKLETSLSGIDSFFAGLSYTDYQHQEIEGVELGTQFTNKASELRSYIKHTPWNDWHGVIGIQHTMRDFSAVGDEAIVPASTTKTVHYFG
jgi:iron complex outermembrane receptor protein